MDSSQEHNMENKEKKGVVQYLVAGVILLIVAIIAWFGYIYFSAASYEDVQLDEITWNGEPNIVAINTAERQGEVGLLTIRVQNGKEQFFAGEWDVDFASANTLYAFGEFPYGYSEEPGQHIYRVNEQGLEELAVTDADYGELMSVTENPRSTYVLSEVLRDTRQTYCLAERIDDGDGRASITCDQLDFVEGTRVRWNPDHDQNVLGLDLDDVIHVYDPWEETFDAVDEDADPELYPELIKYFETQEDLSNLYDRIISTQMGQVVVSYPDAEDETVRVPFGSDVAWLADANHFLLRDGDSLYIYEISSQRRALLAEGDYITSATITLSNGIVNQEL